MYIAYRPGVNGVITGARQLALDSDARSEREFVLRRTRRLLHVGLAVTLLLSAGNNGYWLATGESLSSVLLAAPNLFAGSMMAVMVGAWAIYLRSEVVWQSKLAVATMFCISVLGAAMYGVAPERFTQSMPPLLCGVLLTLRATLLPSTK